MIQIASNKDDIIFDPFMGVGSVGVASLEMERKFIGIEINPEYFSAAKERIDNTMKKHNTQDNNIVSEPIAERYNNQPVFLNGIDDFVKKHQENIDISFSHIHTNVLLKEVGKNLASKMPRMKK